MPEPVPHIPCRDDAASSLERMGRPEERPVRPQWSGLFLEPDLPPADEE
jgi:hypothetical protein